MQPVRLPPYAGNLGGRLHPQPPEGARGDRQQQLPVERKNKKGSVVVDIKEAVERLEILNPQQSIIVLKKVGSLTIRPALVMKAVFQLTDRQILTAMITKRKTEYV